eukprot:2524541-Pleurochrysis_carterae.AAC.1
MHLGQALLAKAFCEVAHCRFVHQSSVYTEGKFLARQLAPIRCGEGGSCCLGSSRKRRRRRRRPRTRTDCRSCRRGTKAPSQVAEVAAAAMAVKTAACRAVGTGSEGRLALD